MIVDISELPEDKKQEIVEKEWKTAILPTPEELAAEKSKSPKARNNPNSRKNLIQYQKNKPKEVKEKIVNNLVTKTKRDVVNPFDYIKIEDENKRKIMKSLLSSPTALASAEEEITFYEMINTFLLDFDLEELSSSDFDDIINIAMNRILVDRLYNQSSNKPSLILDISASVERIKKQTKELKQNLAARRSDRVDTRNKQIFSITDLVFAYDDQKRKELKEKVDKLEKDKEEFIKNKNERK